VEYYDDLFPTFNNLTQLVLISLDSWQSLVDILNHCPKLQNLELDQPNLTKNVNFFNEVVMYLTLTNTDYKQSRIVERLFLITTEKEVKVVDLYVSKEMVGWEKV